MHIKKIVFHFNTNSSVLEVEGEFAQQAYDNSRMVDDIVVVNKESGGWLYIPQTSIRYTEVIPCEKANKLELKIRLLEDELNSAVDEIISREYDTSHISYEDTERWKLEGGVLYINDALTDDIYTVHEPDLIRQFKKFEALKYDLEQIVGEDR